MEFLSEFTDHVEQTTSEISHDEIPMLKHYIEQYDKAITEGNTETAKLIKSMMDSLKSDSGIAENQEILEKGVFRETFTTRDSVSEIQEQNDAILGNPEGDAEVWHKQTESYSCSIACQTYITEQLTGEPVKEADFIQLARDNNWYFPQEGGTYPRDLGKLCELKGLNVEKSYDNSFETLKEMVASDSKAIVNVNNMVLANAEYAKLPGISANHSVEVIGIDMTDPNHIEVILNDPGVENGGGIRHSLDTFMKAWNTSSNFICEISK